MEKKTRDDILLGVAKFVGIIFILFFLFTIIYGAGLDYYAKNTLHYDYERLTKVCAYPKMYSCDDLNYAAPYCTPARIEGQSKCGQNLSVVMMP